MFLVFLFSSVEYLTLMKSQAKKNILFYVNLKKFARDYLGSFKKYSSSLFFNFLKRSSEVLI